ncbi:MAG: zinc-binding dehydrogenase [Nocardiopsis sp. BM-2018]|nr:MAG: zinc-binding dehydrogenase [Nocardiopsis sp. BM-2018]
MHALVHDPDAPQGLRIAEVGEPRPGPAQALVRVSAVSLNFGEIAFQAGVPGAVVGFDAAGVVERSAADGSGPAEGTRVATFGWSQGWAELRAVDTEDIAVVPDSVDLGEASTLPVAGVTALQALRRLGSVIGRRVLVTGASGGVGRYAVQLAALAGAEVVASVGGPHRAEGLRELGAAEIVFGPEKLSAPVHGVLDNVGGAQLAQAFGHLEAGGILIAIGMAAKEHTLIDFETERSRGPLKRIEPFIVDTPFGPDLDYLLRLVESDRLAPQVGWRGSWEKAAEAAEALLGRRVRGKAVLDLSG